MHSGSILLAWRLRHVAPPISSLRSNGIGELVRHTDPHGASLTFTYGAADPDVHQFVPLTGITDAAGQTVTVTNDAVGRITGFTPPRRPHLAARDFYQAALDAGRGGATAPARVKLAQEIIDAWK